MMQRRQFLYLAATPLFAAGNDPWPASALIEPGAFNRELASEPGGVSIFYVGFPVLYRAAHISGAVLAGACSKPAGLADLQTKLAKLPRSRNVILYCGCCPFEQCPNIRPAYTAAGRFKFASLRVLHLATNLHTDWIVKGYPVEKGGTG